MRSIQRIIFASCFAYAVSFANNWSGALVDLGCYNSMQSNVSHDAGHVSKDNKRAIRYCAPSSNTKSFAVLDGHGSTLILDASGNEKAQQLCQKVGKKSPFMVNVSGAVSNDTLAVETIAAK